MEGHWEHGTKQQEQPEREWVVEYRVDIENASYHHLSMLKGKDSKSVQATLFEELRTEYSHVERIDVTVIRLEPVETHSRDLEFDMSTMFQP